MSFLLWSAATDAPWWAAFVVTILLSVKSIIDGVKDYKKRQDQGKLEEAEHLAQELSNKLDKEQAERVKLELQVEQEHRLAVEAMLRAQREEWEKLGILEELMKRGFVVRELPSSHPPVLEDHQK